MDGSSSLEAFTRWVSRRRGPTFADYSSLHRWSVSEPAEFWDDVAVYFGVEFTAPATRTLASRSVADTQWFPGAQLNYAAHALRVGPGKADEDVAILAEDENGEVYRVTHGQLRTDVAALSAALRAAAVQPGDRVAAVLPNSPHAVIAFLATAAIGAIWTCASPDFGQQAIVDRFAQAAPVALIGVDGYRYSGKEFETTTTLDAVLETVPSITTTILVDAIGSPPRAPWIAWQSVLEGYRGTELTTTPVSFDHPLWILYSSGTTGLPKGLVHSHGGILLEHLKTLSLQMDLGPDDRFMWFTTTGWMMWNLLVSGLLVGCTIVLYDGNPGVPNLGRLWQMTQRHRISYLGISAALVQASLKQGLRPSSAYDLTCLRAVGSTGSPLSADGFEWIANAVSSSAQICSISGGTDVCTAFLGTAPTVPVWQGELSCPALGADIRSFDDAGREVNGGTGELVITTPMPSMPRQLWNDPDGNRLHEAYFADFPGAWRHGDWISMSSRGSAVILGRSDATLNRGGIRMGTAEFYRILESLDGIRDCLVVDTTSSLSASGSLICFVVLADGYRLESVEEEVRTSIRTQLSPRHVPDQLIEIPSVPRTLNGKKCEVPVKRILTGVPIDRAVKLDTLANPDSLATFEALAAKPTL